MDRLENLGQVPEMNKPDIQLAQKLKYKNSEAPAPRKPNSLWQPGSRTFFRDQRARAVGDILRVKVEIKESAKLDNKTERKRDGSDKLGMPNLVGFEQELIKDGRITPTSIYDVSSKTKNTGNGKTERKEDIKTIISSMVTEILPNGNLVIQGSQEMRVNFDVREITVTGIVRPEDISAENTINLDQIAEARVSYGGRGQIFDLQQPRIGTQVIDILSPF